LGQANNETKTIKIVGLETKKAEQPG